MGRKKDTFIQTWMKKTGGMNIAQLNALSKIIKRRQDKYWEKW
tara:strand:- start:2278 stop:2406 length:129 start_codon:yes stop_codon:yes gene_type:complete